MSHSDSGNGGTSVLAALLLLSLIILPFGMTTLVEQNLLDYEQSLRSRLKFEIYLREQTTPDEVQLLINQVKIMEGFSQFSYRDREEVFRSMQMALGTNLLPDDAPNPFPSVVEVTFDPKYSTLTHFESISMSTNKFPFIEDVNFGSEWLEAHERTFASATKILSALRIITAGCSLILMFWFMKRVVNLRNEYYAMLRRLGAGWRILAFPFILRKTALGVAAAALSLLALYACFAMVSGWSVEINFVTAANIMVVLGFGGLVALLSAALAVGPEL